MFTFSDFFFSTLHRWPKHQFAKQKVWLNDRLNLWTVLFVSHFVRFGSFKCILLYKIRKGYNRRLIGYSYLVLGTRSAAKFEKVPSTSLHRVIVRCHAQSTRGPSISRNTKMLRYLWCNPDYPQSKIQCTSYRVFFLTGPPLNLLSVGR